ncbi:hypothetical protein [Kitasatospora sp. NPDC002040]|uniref:hypothetical protein n=1 Tax=Kitasatospora sp. NPDC002040 TaxID=3154661 RepID=UPI00331C92D5
MKRRKFVLLGALGLSPLALLVRPSGEKPAKSATNPVIEAPEVFTDLEPVRRSLARLGPVISTHWTETSSRRPNDRFPIGPADFLYDIRAQLPPGQVTALLGARPTTPAQLPPVQHYPAPYDQRAPDTIPAPLLPHLPPAAAWLACPSLDGLLSASRGTILFDRASDTVYVQAANLGDPTKPQVMVDVHGTSSTTTPVPLPPLP